MKEEVLKSKLNELYLPSDKAFTIVDVPQMKFVMIDGQGRLDSQAYPEPVKWLFSVVHPIKQIARQRMGKRFVEPPLEGLWWSNDIQDLVSGNKDKLKWRMMIVAADWVTDQMFEDAVASAKNRLGEVPDSLRLEYFNEGKSVQIMHIGPPEKQVPTMSRLHKEFLPEHDLVPNGYHHEIYLNDPNRVAPEKLKTVLRQPVRTCA